MKLLIILIGIVSLSVAQRGFRSNYEKCLKYLEKYEWIRAGKVNSKNDKQIRQQIKGPLRKMQKYYNLKKTGLCDKATIKFMSKARCGNSDASVSGIYASNGAGALVRQKRWAVIEGVPAWTDSQFGFSLPITIGYRNYHPAMTQGAQDEALIYCATRWAEASGLTFQLAFGQPTANIYIGFIPAIDEDDGQFGVLAMAESPTPFRTPPESLIEFDAREPWVAKWTPNQRDNTISFQAVLCHEIGHSLALDHSEDRSAVMFGELIPQNSEVILTQDDKDGMQSLYGQSDGQVLVNAAPIPAPSVVPPAPPVGPPTLAPIPTPAPVPIPTPAPNPFPAATKDPRGRIVTPFPKPATRERGRCTGIKNRRKRIACLDGLKPRGGRVVPVGGRGRDINRGGRRPGRFRNVPRRRRF